MGEGKIRKKRPVLLALAVLQGCTLKLTKHLVPGTDCGRKRGVGTEGDQGQEGTDVSLYLTQSLFLRPCAGGRGNI